MNRKVCSDRDKPVSLMLHTPDGQQNFEDWVVGNHVGGEEAFGHIYEKRHAVALLWVPPSVHCRCIVCHVERKRSLFVPEGVCNEATQLVPGGKPHPHERLMKADEVSMLAKHRLLLQILIVHAHVDQRAAARLTAIHLHRPLPIGHVDDFSRVEQDFVAIIPHFSPEEAPLKSAGCQHSSVHSPAEHCRPADLGVVFHVHEGCVRLCQIPSLENFSMRPQ
mmetsp:Transcript_8635/g.25917  ORF Transcript_8635/g.25917 Transcript_8635/m.25917 type:complete len:221 (-) Transcript_8635:436-1098(-)